MASGVFGTVISEETVTATGEYKEPVTQKDVADYAMKMINAGGKDVDAQKFLDNLKDRSVRPSVCLCVIAWVYYEYLLPVAMQNLYFFSLLCTLLGTVME